MRHADHMRGSDVAGRGPTSASRPALPIRGRDGEIVHLRAVLDTVHAGRGASVLVEGAPGVGKSRLLAELDVVARRSGCDVVWVRADELDQFAPHAALHSALRPPTGSGGTTAADDQRLRLLDSMTEVLEDRTRHAPVVVLVDDAQWADPATLFALRTLPKRLAASRILWVLAVRPGHERPIVVRMQEDLERFGAERLKLRPLPPQELRQVAADVLGASPGPDLSRLLRDIAGSPFLAVQLMLGFVEAGAVTVEAGEARLVSHDLPAGFRRSIAGRLDVLPEDGTRLLQIGSVLGREFDLGTVARMLGRPAGSLLSGVESALAADLLSADGPRLSFRHDLIRQAVYDVLPVPVRSALHQEAADILRGTGGRSAEAAWHVVLSGGPVDDDAISMLHHAVRELSSTVPEAAADLAQKAAGLLPVYDRRRIALLTEAAEQLGSTRRVHEALELVDRTMSDGLDPEQEASLRLVAAEIHQAAGDDIDAMTHLERALALPELPADLRVRLSKTKATGHIYLGDIAAAEQADTGLVEAAYRSEDPPLVVSAMVFQSQTHFYRGFLTRAVQLAEAADSRIGKFGAVHLRPPRIPALWLATALVATDRVEDAERVLREGQRETEDAGLGWSLPYWHTCRAAVLCEKGALDDAVVEAEAGLAVADELEITRVLPLARSILAVIEVRRGDLTKAADHFRAAETGSSPARSQYGPWVSLAGACLADAQGRPAEAVAALAGAYGRGEVARLLVVPPSHWPQIVRIALRAGDRSLAQGVAGALRRLAAENDSQEIVRAVCAHADGLLSGDLSTLTSALTGYRRSGRPLALAAACEDLGGLVIASDEAAAVPYFEEAARLVAEAGALRDHGRIKRRLRQLGVRTGAAGGRTAPASGWGTLTESERKVIPLVADGLTNRAIAERLYLSVHTVNTHLKHIFTKLDINTRVELTRLAIERGGLGEEAD